MANQQASVTMTGFVASDLVKGGNDNFVVLSFRMGSTRSRLNPNTRQWEDFGTAWITVKAFRSLALNGLQSIRRGDRIIVVGVLNTEQWTNEQGEVRSRTVLEASNIGHDLTFGTTNLAKSQRANGNGNSNGTAGAAGSGDAASGNVPADGAEGRDAGSGVALPQRPVPPVEFDSAVSRQVPSDSGTMPSGVAVEQPQTAVQESYGDDFADEPDM